MLTVSCAAARRRLSRRTYSGSTTGGRVGEGEMVEVEETDSGLEKTLLLWDPSEDVSVLRSSLGLGEVRSLVFRGVSLAANSWKERI